MATIVASTATAAFYRMLVDLHIADQFQKGFRTGNPYDDLYLIAIFIGEVEGIALVGAFGIIRLLVQVGFRVEAFDVVDARLGPVKTDPGRIAAKLLVAQKVHGLDGTTTAEVDWLVPDSPVWNNPVVRTIGPVLRLVPIALVFTSPGSPAVTVGVIAFASALLLLDGVEQDLGIQFQFHELGIGLVAGEVVAEVGIVDLGEVLEQLPAADGTTVVLGRFLFKVVAVVDMDLAWARRFDFPFQGVEAGLETVVVIKVAHLYRGLFHGSLPQVGGFIVGSMPVDPVAIAFLAEDHHHFASGEGGGGLGIGLHTGGGRDGSEAGPISYRLLGRGILSLNGGMRSLELEGGGFGRATARFR